MSLKINFTSSMPWTYEIVGTWEKNEHIRRECVNIEAGLLANGWELTWGDTDEKEQILEVGGYQQNA